MTSKNIIIIVVLIATIFSGCIVEEIPPIQTIKIISLYQNDNGNIPIAFTINNETMLRGIIIPINNVGLRIFYSDETKMIYQEGHYVLYWDGKEIRP